MKTYKVTFVLWCFHLWSRKLSR